MEELADAIEDAQYVNAIATQEDGPRPVLAWDKPSETELMAWKERLLAQYNTNNKFRINVAIGQQQQHQQPQTSFHSNRDDNRDTAKISKENTNDDNNKNNNNNDNDRTTTIGNSTTATTNGQTASPSSASSSLPFASLPPLPRPFSMEWCCQQELGYFLFSQYVKTVGRDAYGRMNFSEDAWRFAQLPSKPARLIAAVQMARDYLGLDQVPIITTTTTTTSAKFTTPIPTATTTTIATPSATATTADAATADTATADTANATRRSSTTEELLLMDQSQNSYSAEELLMGTPPQQQQQQQPLQYYHWRQPPRTEIVEYSLARRVSHNSSVNSTMPHQQQYNTINAISSSFSQHHHHQNHFATTNVNNSHTATTTTDSQIMAISKQSKKRTIVQEAAHRSAQISSLDGMTDKELETMFKINNDYPYCSESVVGVKGPILKEILSLIEQVATALVKMQTLSSGNNKNNKGTSSKTAKESYCSDSSFGTDGENSDRFLKTAHRMASSPFLEHRIASVSASAVVVADTNGNVDVEERRKENGNEISTADTELELHDSPRAIIRDVNNNIINNPKGLSRSVFQKGSGNEKMSLVTPSLAALNEPFIPTNLFEKAEYLAMESLRRQYWDGFVNSAYWTKLMHFLWYQDRRVQPDDFFIMRVLGRGGFGLVTACKKGTSGKLYAMKVMNKRRIKMKKSEQLAIYERNALAAVESKFVINLKYSFHSKEDVFLILDLMTGGDLGYHLHQRRRFSKKECLYYAARIMLGLQAMHDEDYVYRDLKPENCLLAEDGRVKITDLGLATKITPTLRGAAGTRGYWAPEMLRRDPDGKRSTYGHTVDWFSFGCCVAEFISGWNPFRSEAALNFGGEKGMPTKEKMIDCATMEMIPEFPPGQFECDAADLCRRLLDKNEKTRLGHNGCEEIMAHPWFKSVNWESIISDRKRPPFIPSKDVNAASQSEIGMFTEDKTYQQTTFTAVDEEVYKNWDWTNPRAFAAEVIEFWIYERVTGEPLVPTPQHATCCCSIS